MDAYIVDGVFTPRASVKKGISAYSEVHPQELVAACLKSLRDRQPETLDKTTSALVGCVSQVNDQGGNLARNALLTAGLNQTISAATINMCCGSGLETVNLAAASVASGSELVALAGGVESMSRVKMASDGAGMDGNNLQLRNELFQVPQGISADFIAGEDGISREELDRYALGSHQKAARAKAQNYFSSVHALVRDADGKPLLTEDDHIRAEATLEAISDLQPAFAKLAADFTTQGIIGPQTAIPRISPVHTAATSSGIADGASMLLVASERHLKQNNVKAKAQILGTRSRGSDPITMLTGPADCCLELLQSCGLTPKDVDLWEINEAFAVVPIQTIRRLKIDESRVNIEGGAISRGHPLGATGAILLTSLLLELEKENKSIGCVVLCVAGGQSVATLIQRC